PVNRGQASGPVGLRVGGRFFHPQSEGERADRRVDARDQRDRAGVRGHVERDRGGGGGPAGQRRRGAANPRAVGTIEEPHRGVCARGRGGAFPRVARGFEEGGLREEGRGGKGSWAFLPTKATQGHDKPNADPFLVITSNLVGRNAH